MKTAEDYLVDLQGLLPPGIAWNRDPNSNMGRLLLALADGLSRVDGRVDDFINELDPATTYEMLPDWEAAFGLPDPCVGPGQTVAQRRAALISRITFTGDQSPAGMIALAASLGYTITILEHRPRRMRSAMGTPYGLTDWAYTVDVQAPLNTIRRRAHGDPMGEPYAVWGNTLLECVFQAIKPAHLILRFTYS